MLAALLVGLLFLQPRAVVRGFSIAATAALNAITGNWAYALLVGSCCIEFRPIGEAAARSVAVAAPHLQIQAAVLRFGPGQQQAQGFEVITDAAIQLNTKGNSRVFAVGDRGHGCARKAHPAVDGGRDWSLHAAGRSESATGAVLWHPLALRPLADHLREAHHPARG